MTMSSSVRCEAQPPPRLAHFPSDADVSIRSLGFTACTVAPDIGPHLGGSAGGAGRPSAVRSREVHSHPAARGVAGAHPSRAQELCSAVVSDRVLDLSLGPMCVGGSACGRACVPVATLYGLHSSVHVEDVASASNEADDMSSTCTRQRRTGLYLSSLQPARSHFLAPQKTSLSVTLVEPLHVSSTCDPLRPPSHIFTTHRPSFHNVRSAPPTRYDHPAP